MVLVLTKKSGKEVKLKLVRSFSLKLFDLWYAAAPQWAKDRVLCGSGYHEKVTYWEASCTKTCSVMTSVNNQPVYVLTQVSCVDLNYCCGVHYKYCKDANGNTVVDESAVGHVINCYVTPFPDPSGCPEGTDLEVSYCNDNCLLQ